MKPLLPFHVIYQTAEDGLGDTVKPRLIEAEADLDRVLVIDEAKRELTLSDERIEKAITQNGARLIILDPIQAYTRSRVRTLTLIVSGTKFTGRLLKAAITKYMAHRKEKKLNKQKSRDSPIISKGKQTVKQLVGQNQGVSNIEITDPSIKEFEKIARKYGVDYAVKKDRSTSPPKYLIFFKGRDADALTAAFTEYTGKKVKKAEKTERPSVLAKLNQFKELVKNAVVDRTKRKELER